MQKTAQSIQAASLDLFILVATAFLLLLASVNITNYLEPKKVLGTKIESGDSDREIKFWNNFLTKNPNYIPGWMAIGRMDKVKEIDPNYKLDISD